ncbi:hypothetical protein OROGR_005782 [Orobanche gracilis]
METYIQAMTRHYSKLLSICLLILLNTQLVRSDSAEITWIHSAVSKGAVCTDGSPPAYSLAKGFGSGVNNWLIYIEAVVHGVKRYMNAESEQKDGLVVVYTDPTIKPITAVCSPETKHIIQISIIGIKFILYTVMEHHFWGMLRKLTRWKTNLTYRGSRVFDAIMEEVLAKGLNDADNVILAGSSAGALATILHCDSFRALVPNANRVKCISDSGFFLHAKNLPGAKEREDYFTKVVELHGLQKYLPTSCTSKMNPGLCLFPEYLVEDIQTPLFILESSFDSHQASCEILEKRLQNGHISVSDIDAIKEMLTPYIGGGKPEWNYCVNQSLTFCNSTQIEIMQEFQKTFIHTLQNLKYSPSRGMFVHTCYLHTHIYKKEDSSCSSVMNNILENKTVAEAIGDWYFDRSWFQHIDINNNMPRNCTSNLSSDAFNRECIDQLKNNH